MAAEQTFKFLPKADHGLADHGLDVDLSGCQAFLLSTISKEKR
jgi:hypothetical protein